MIDANYMKEYRKKLGFTNQTDVKIFFGAKDLFPAVDYNYVASLNERLYEIVEKLHELVVEEIRVENKDNFCKANIDNVYEKLKEYEILSRLNNQGRRPEKVYFSWMRGFVITAYFQIALSRIFEIDVDEIVFIGDDELKNQDTFRRTPKADLEVKQRDGDTLRVEIQSGFQGINDVKQGKVLEALRIKRVRDISTVAIHFDIFNGQVAFIDLDKISEDNHNWITRQQMEGQTVFNIDQNLFIWKLTEKPPIYREISE